MNKKSMNSRYDLVTVGNAMVDAFLIIHREDEFVRVNHDTSELCVRFGEKIPVDSCIFSLGGNAANVAVGLARYGFRSTLFAEIGDDELSLKITNSLKRENIDRAWIVQNKNSSTSFSVCLSFQNERTLFSEHVVRKHKFKFGDIQTQWMYLTSMGKEWIAAYEDVLSIVRNSSIKLAFNPGSVQLERENEHRLKSVVEHTSMLFVNREEAETILFGSEHITENKQPEYIKTLLYKLQRIGAKQAVITDGQYGSYVIDEASHAFHLGLYPCRIVERTGAGDAFSSGFMGAILSGLSVSQAMQFAAVNSASVIEHIGAQTGLLNKCEIEDKLEKADNFFVHAL